MTHAILHPYNPKKMEKNIMETIGALSPEQHDWFDKQVTALKSESLTAKKYAERLIKLIAEAKKQK